MWSALRALGFLGSEGEEEEERDDVLLPSVRVAIVGAGVGGCSAAYFMRERGGEAVEVDVFEKGKVGGRTATHVFCDHTYETGASIIHATNRYMVDFSKEFGLETKRDVTEVPIGIFNGSKYIFRLGFRKFFNILCTFWYYGFSLFRINSVVKSTLARFTTIYDLQAKGRAYRTVSDMLLAMGGEEMWNLTQVSAEDYLLRTVRLPEALVNELITAAIRLNYGQGLSVNACTCLTSLVAMEETSLWCVVGGNKLIPERALEKSGATLHRCAVTSIRRVEKGGGVVYAVQSRDASTDSIVMKEYDAVIIAAPLAEGEIEFVDFPQPIFSEAVTSTRYHRTVAEFIKGEIDPEFFGASDNDRNFPLFTLTTDLSDDVPFPFCSVNIEVPSEEPEGALVEYIRPVTECPTRVWKVFSPRPLTEEEKQMMFRTIEAQTTVDWLAYPEYNPPEAFPPFVLDDGVFYINGIEKVASAMEMSVIGAKNCTLLARQYLMDRPEL